MQVLGLLGRRQPQRRARGQVTRAKLPLWLYGHGKERLFGFARRPPAERGPFQRSISSCSPRTSSRSLFDPSRSHPEALPSRGAWEKPAFPLFLQSRVNTRIVTIFATYSFVIELRSFLRKKKKDAPLSTRGVGDGQLAQIGALRERPATPATEAPGWGGQRGDHRPRPPSASPKKVKARLKHLPLPPICRFLVLARLYKTHAPN